MKGFKSCIVLVLLLLGMVALGACTGEGFLGMGNAGGDAREARSAPAVTVNVSPVATNAYGAAQGSGSTTEAWGDTNEGTRTGTAGAATGDPSASASIPK